MKDQGTKNHGVELLHGVQYFAEMSEGIDTVPAEVRQITKDIPVEWDESKFIDGYPAKHVVIARRKGSAWNIASVNGEQVEKKLSVDLSFIQRPKTNIRITGGADSRSFEINTDRINTKTTLENFVEAK